MNKEYNYEVEVSAEGYETTTFHDYGTARDYYNKLIQLGLNAKFIEL